MIKKYQQYLIENVLLSNDIIIEIIKSLEGGDNSKLLNKLINYSDSKGKSVFMSILQTKNSELIDYVLNFEIDLNHIDKNGQNAYFYCKNSETLKKLYNLGIDFNVKSTGKSKKNVLLYLSNAKIFNVDIYKKMIDGGVDIDEVDSYNSSVLSYSILNKGITSLLINNNANLNNISQLDLIQTLFGVIRWYPKRRNFAINMFKLLFDNGMKINDNKKFIVEMQNYWYSNKMNMIDEVLYPLKNYITDDMMLELWNGFHRSDRKEFFQNLLHKFKDVTYPKLYYTLKAYYDGVTTKHFYEYFKEYIDEHPYIEESNKYNL